MSLSDNFGKPVSQGHFINKMYLGVFKVTVKINKSIISKSQAGIGNPIDVILD